VLPPRDRDRVDWHQRGVHVLHHGVQLPVGGPGEVL
jgi:hypothetical protein